jgi:hypothetical protein
MNAKNKIDGKRFQFLGRRGSIVKIRRTVSRKQLDGFRRQRPRHDPMLVLNMSIFNVADGWNRIFNPVKAHENAAS